MKIEQNQLISDLIEMTNSHISRVKALKKLDETQLNFKRDENSWSVLECMEHLIRYGDFYLPEIHTKTTGSHTNSSQYFKSGVLGNYFANSMMPKEKLNKMKTFKSMNPNNSSLSISVIDTLLTQLTRMIELLNNSKNVDLQKVKTAISISTLITLRLGDTFRVVIYHNERHIQQAEKIQ